MYRQLAVLSLFVIVSFAQSIPTFPSQYTTNFTGQTGISHNPANFKGELFIDTVDLQARFNEFLPTDGVYLIDISYCQSNNSLGSWSFFYYTGGNSCKYSQVNPQPACVNGFNGTIAQWSPVSRALILGINPASVYNGTSSCGTSTCNIWTTYVQGSCLPNNPNTETWEIDSKTNLPFSFSSITYSSVDETCEQYITRVTFVIFEAGSFSSSVTEGYVSDHGSGCVWTPPPQPPPETLAQF